MNDQYYGYGVISFEEACELDPAQIKERIEQRYQELLTAEGEEAAMDMLHVATLYIKDEGGWFIKKEDWQEAQAARWE